MFGLDLKKSFLFGGPKRVRDTGPGKASTLFLHCTETGWRSQLVRLDGAPTQPNGGDAPPRKPSNTERRIDAVSRLAAETLGALPDVKEVVILTDEPAVHYTDTLGEVFRSAANASPALLRKRGAEELNATRVVFGTAPFRANNRVRAEGTAAFADAVGIGACLGRLDKLAARVASVTPVADVLARRPRADDAPAAALYVGGWSTLVVLTNPAFGAVTVRSLPIGVVGLLEKLATGMNGTLEEVQEAAQRRDLLEEIILDPALLALGDSDRGEADRAIGDEFRALVHEIATTMDFFEHQRAAGRAERIEVFGEHERFRDLLPALSRGLDIPTEAAPTTVLDLLIEAESRLNLLENTGDQLIVGKVPHTLHKGRLTAAASVPAPPRAPASPAKRPGRSTASRHPTPARNSSFQELLSKFGLNSGPKAVNEEYPDENAAPTNERQYFLSFGFFILLIFYWGYDQHEAAAVSSRGAAETVAKKAAESSELRGKTHRESFARAGDGTSDKVLWTEKFIAISANMDERMWLTDVYLTTETRSISGSSVLSKKLIIEGAVLPSTNGHILEVARFICRLENDPFNRGDVKVTLISDAPTTPVAAPAVTPAVTPVVGGTPASQGTEGAAKPAQAPPETQITEVEKCVPGEIPANSKTDLPGFMADFRDIKFHGATIDQSESDSIIRFRIEAIYDKNKRLENKQTTAAKPGALGNLEKGVDKNNAEKEQYLNPQNIK